MEVPGESPICGENLGKNSINGLEIPTKQWETVEKHLGNYGKL
jgi:hypothetical protein